MQNWNNHCGTLEYKIKQICSLSFFAGEQPVISPFDIEQLKIIDDIDL